jgi:hypothetical protein
LASFFISHAWIHGAYYRELSRWLTEYCSPSAEDLSIPEDAALAMLGRKSEHSELRQQELADQIKSIQRRLTELNQLSSLPNIEAQLRESDEIWIERNPSWGLRLVAFERRWLAQKRDRLLAFAQSLPASSINEQLAAAGRAKTQLENQVLALDKEKTSQRTAQDIIFKLQKFGRLDSGALQSVQLSLADEIEARVARADLIFIIAETWSQYRGWLSYELERAVAFKKPIISVRMRNEETIPPRLTRLSSAVATWSRNSVYSSINHAI